jgi:hypothetical protein
MSLNPRLSSATASWFHESGITGSGSWNFGSYMREDIVEIYGSTGKITSPYSKMYRYC